MKRGLAALFVLFIVGFAAHASSYDDFALGITANIRGEPEQAIAYFTAALKSGDLAPAYLPVAYRGRANAYLEIHRCKEAEADIDAYAALKSLDRAGHFLRADVKICLKDWAGAQQEFDAAMSVYASGSQYWRFGRLLWNNGMFEAAAVDLQRGAELIEKKRNPQAYYVVLWAAMAADRVGKLDAAKLADFVDELSGSDWPEPLLKLYMGKLKPDEVAKKAARARESETAGQKCEADFYTAEWLIARKDAAGAKPLIESAIANCPKNFIEYRSAIAEGERMGLPIPKEQQE